MDLQGEVLQTANRLASQIANEAIRSIGSVGSVRKKLFNNIKQTEHNRAQNQYKKEYQQTNDFERAF